MRWKRGLLLGVPILLVLVGLILRGDPDAPPPDTPPEGVGEDAPAPPGLPAHVEAPGNDAPEIPPAGPSEPCEIRIEVKAHTKDWPRVPDAVIRAWRLDDRGRVMGPMAATGRSGEDGICELPVPGPGRYFLQVEAPGHALESGRAKAPGRYTFTPRTAVRVEVVVCDVEGIPLPGAVVLRRPDEAVHTIEIPCDRDGRARLDWNTFDYLGARFGDLGSGMRRRSPPKDGGPIRIKLYRTWCVGGTVEDEAGEPIANARLLLDHEGPGDMRLRSAPDGAFLFDGTSFHRRAELRVWADGYAEHRRSVVRGDREVRVVLRPPVVLRGRVLDHEGAGVAAARVELETSMGHHEALADDAGEFALEGLDPTLEVHEIEAEYPPNRQKVRMRGPTPLGEPVTIRFPPAHASWLVLRVVDGAGNPLSGVTCRAEGRPATTDADGRAVLRSSRPVGEEVEVNLHRWGGGGSWKRTVPAAAAEDAPPVPVRSPGEKGVRFRVVDPAGGAIPNAEVEFLATPGNPSSQRKGPLHFVLKESRVYNVRVGAVGYAPVRRAVYVYADTKTAEFVLHPVARVRGRTSPSFAICVNGGYERHATGTDGAFDIEVPAGELSLTAWDANQRPRAHADLRLRAGETRDIGELPAVEATEITGVVADEAGAPLGGATLVLRTSITGLTSWGDNTHADGAFSLPTADAGEWILIAAKEGRAADVRILSGASASGQLRLICPRGEAVLRVRVRNGGTGARQKHHLRFPDCRIPLEWPFRDRRSEGDDRVLVYRGLPSGEITFLLTLSPTDGTETSVVERTVSLAAGKTTEIEIRVP